MKKNIPLIFGLHAVTAAIKKNPDRISHLAVLQNRNDQKIQQIIQLAKTHNIKIEWASRDELDRMSEAGNHQGVIAFSVTEREFSEDDLKNILKQNPKSLLLILDGVQDPHNLGACMRTAEAAGVAAVIAPRDRSVGLTPTVAKVASGAVERVPFIQVTNLARTLQFLKENNIWIYGADAEAEKSLYDVNFAGGIAIVLGSEGYGLRRLTRENCDVLIKIPMRGEVESLNVSVTAGIVLFEVLRQMGNHL